MLIHILQAKQKKLWITDQSMNVIFVDISFSFNKNDEIQIFTSYFYSRKKKARISESCARLVMYDDNDRKLTFCVRIWMFVQ